MTPLKLLIFFCLLPLMMLTMFIKKKGIGMSKLEELKQVIQATVPEILELKFGCKVKVSHNKVPYGEYRGFILEAGLRNLTTIWTDENIEMIPKSRILHILGRPIRLSDVFSAIYEMRSHLVFPADLAVTMNAYEKNKEENLFVLKVWNFSDDNLDRQSSECIDFLHNLLVTKNT